MIIEAGHERLRVLGYDSQNFKHDGRRPEYIEHVPSDMFEKSPYEEALDLMRIASAAHDRATVIFRNGGDVDAFVSARDAYDLARSDFDTAHASAANQA